MVAFSIMYFQIWCSKNGNKNQGISYHCLLAGVVTSASIQTTYTHHANVVIQFLITSKNRYTINAEISRWTKHHLRTLNKENKYEYPSLSTKNINQCQYVRWYLNAKGHFKTVWRINIFQVTIILLYVNFVVCLLVVCSEIEAKNVNDSILKKILKLTELYLSCVDIILLAINALFITVYLMMISIFNYWTKNERSKIVIVNFYITNDKEKREGVTSRLFFYKMTYVNQMTTYTKFRFM